MRFFPLLLLVLVGALVLSGEAEALHRIPLWRRRGVAGSDQVNVIQRIPYMPNEHQAALGLNTSRVAFSGPIQLGTPPQEFQVIFDTGSSDSWVLSVATNMCENKLCYDPSMSTTKTLDGRKFNIEYGNGPVYGFFINDTLRIGSFTLNQTFAIVTDVSGMGKMYKSSMWDGVVGMGWPDGSHYNITPPIFSLFDNDKNITKQFAFYFPRNTTDAGELVLGGYDTAHFRGSLVSVPLITKTHWTVNMTSAKIGDTVLSNPALALVDSGASFISVPRMIFDEIMNRISAMNVYNGFVLNCRKVPTLPNITLEIGGMKWVLTGEDYTSNVGNSLCLLNFDISNAEINGATTWILGQAFLRHVYTVFDVDHESLLFAYAK